MKAEELRIGNIVDYYGNEVTINSVNDTDVGFSDYVPIDYPLLDEIKPIPLTEEWLVRFGFFVNFFDSEIVGEKIYQFNSWTIYMQGDVWLFNQIDDLEIKYVHQLQNLYFTLTGEELNYEKATQN